MLVKRNWFGNYLLSSDSLAPLKTLSPHYNFLWSFEFSAKCFWVICFWPTCLVRRPEIWRESRWCFTDSRLDWVSGFTKRYIVTEYESPQREVFHHTRKPSLTLTLNCALIAWNIKCVNWKSIREQKDDRSLTWSLPEWSCWFSSDGPQEWCQAQPAGWGRGARPG